MASRIQNITIDQGADFNQLFVAYSTKSSTSPKNLTDYTFASEMRKSYYHANSALTFTAVVDTAASGTMTLSANNMQTSAVSPGRYVYDIEIISNAEVPIRTRIIEGIATVTPEATKE